MCVTQAQKKTAHFFDKNHIEIILKKKEEEKKKAKYVGTKHCFLFLKIFVFTILK